MKDLFVMVCDDPRVWRLKAHSDRILYLEAIDRRESVAALKTLCRVGTAQDWLGSRRHAPAYEAGGGPS
jgi:hypothetical protein